MGAQRSRSQNPSPHSSSFAHARSGTFFDQGLAGNASAMVTSSSERSVLGIRGGVPGAAFAEASAEDRRAGAADSRCSRGDSTWLPGASSVAEQETKHAASTAEASETKACIQPIRDTCTIIAGRTPLHYRRELRDRWGRPTERQPSRVVAPSRRELSRLYRGEPDPALGGHRSGGHGPAGGKRAQPRPDGGALKPTQVASGKPFSFTHSASDTHDLQRPSKQTRPPHGSLASHRCPYRLVYVHIGAQRSLSQKPSPHSLSFAQVRSGTVFDQGLDGNASAMVSSSGERGVPGIRGRVPGAAFIEACAKDRRAGAEERRCSRGDSTWPPGASSVAEQETTQAIPALKASEQSTGARTIQYS
jgi:hypothetical protein